jgi:hypothetical protein
MIYGGVTGGMGAGRTSSPMNYGPSLAGGASGFGNAWGDYYARRARQTGSQADLANAQRIQQQTAAMQQRQALQDMLTRRQQAAAGQGPSWHGMNTGYAGTPMGDAAQRPTTQPASQPAVTNTPTAQAPGQPQPLGQSGAPQAQGQGPVSMQSGALSQALRSYLGGASTQSDILAKIKALLALQG